MNAALFLSELGLTVNALLAFESLAPTDVVYVSGSLVEGLGNQASDIDVFVVGKVTPKGENVVSVEGTTPVSVHFHGKRRVDFEFWQEAPVVALANRINALRPNVDAAWFSTKELEFVHRLRLGLPVAGTSGFERYKNMFDFEKLAGGLARRAIGVIDDVLEDLYGMLDDGDLDVGLLRSRDLLDACCDAYLHHRGSTNTKPKWRSKLLARLDKDEFGRDVERAFWRLQYPAENPRNDEARANEHIRQCIAFANRVVNTIQG